MEEKIEVGEPKNTIDYEIRDQEGKVIQCILEEGNRCVGPVLEKKIKGYKFECHYENCEEDFIGLSKEEVIEKAKSHLISHSDYY
ncbi:MAG: hypothetical protein KGY68_02025 [Candidatus Thermoplasmatota archaeon]|nr:hypothetical protein [Candidatus Thermoplasmatota archaeon]